MAQLTILGSGNWTNEGGRHQPAFLLKHEDRQLLIDCGDGTLHALEQNGLKVNEIDTVFITHLHPDHVGGLPAVLVARWLRVKVMHSHSEKKQLRIIGPAALGNLIETILPLQGAADFFQQYELWFSPIRSEQDEFKFDDITARPYRVDHAPQLDCYGWQFQLGKKKVVFSGDMKAEQTNRSNVIQSMTAADLLVIEAGASENHSPSHLSAAEALGYVQEASARQVILNHLDDVLEAQARAEMKRQGVSNVTVATDGATFEV